MIVYKTRLFYIRVFCFQIIMSHAPLLLLNFSCVAHLYFLFNTDLNDAVCDATSDAMEYKSRARKKATKHTVRIDFDGIYNYTIFDLWQHHIYC
jgi:hypothetical protein